MLFIKTFVLFICCSCNFMLPMIYFYMIANSYYILWVILCSHQKRKEQLMPTGFIQRISLTSPHSKSFTIHARWLTQNATSPSLNIALAGMPQEAVDRTELFIDSLVKSPDEHNQLQVLVEQDGSKEQVFSITLNNLPSDLYGRTWHFFERLEECF
jgi:hypothetical protein